MNNLFVKVLGDLKEKYNDKSADNNLVLAEELCWDFFPERLKKFITGINVSATSIEIEIMNNAAAFETKQFYIRDLSNKIMNIKGMEKYCGRIRIRVSLDKYRGI
ncbi:hypothetical protein AB834_07085 [PVC group bacterium (ex Bugula neritina AB1)]|nr:hypothetical protein AB834_07085 [PVC group bacterium (ex Bugula neritina AB1)]